VIENTVEAALIIAYRRWENLAKLIEILNSQGIKRIYVAIDRNNSMDDTSSMDVDKTIDIAMRAKSAINDLQIAVHSENVGCSAAVLSACDWFFENEEFGLVFEDDCFPAIDFFTYAKKSKQVIESNNEVWLFCGTQFATSLPEQESWSLSKYALIWGWGTSRKKWIEIASALKDETLKVIDAKISISERQYWTAGAHRSSSGIVDAWDNVLIQRMLSLGKKAILPQFALVSNIGNDSAATHTIGESNWLQIKTGNFSIPVQDPLENPNLDLWLKNKFYKIAWRHIFTTRITKCLDVIKMTSLRVVDLNARWEKAKKNLIPL
jgi:hypothetical protein